MMAGALVTQRTIDQHEIGRRSHGLDLSRRGDDNEKPTAGDKQLLGNEHREWCSYSTSDDADGKPGMLGHIHVRVIAGPAGRSVGVAAGAQVAHNVAVGIEGADGRHVLVRQASLPPGLSQQICWLEY
jgi:hypothetical protein